MLRKVSRPWNRPNISTVIPAVQRERTWPTFARHRRGDDASQGDGAGAGVEQLAEGFADQVEGRLGAGAEDAVDGGLELAGGFGEAGVDARHGGLVGLEPALEEIGLTLGF